MPVLSCMGPLHSTHQCSAVLWNPYKCNKILTLLSDTGLVTLDCGDALLRQLSGMADQGVQPPKMSKILKLELLAGPGVQQNLTGNGPSGGFQVKHQT